MPGPGMTRIAPLTAEAQALYDAAPVGLCLLDRELRYMHINATLAAINRLPVAAHLGRPIQEVLPHFKGEHVALMRRVLEGEEFRGTILTDAAPDHPDGIATFRVNWLPWRDAAGAVQGVLVSAEDISEGAASLRRLAEREALLAAVGASTPDLVYAKDREGRMLYANPATLAALGRPMHAVLGRSSEDLVPGGGGDRLAANDRQVIETGESAVFEEHLPDAQGLTRIYRSTKSPLRDPAGKIVGLVGVSVDDTDRKAAEVRAAFLHDLADRLRDDPRAARVTGEALGRFFGVMRAGFTIADAARGELAVEEDWTDGTTVSAQGVHDMRAFGTWMMDDLAAGRTVRVHDSLADPRIPDPAAYAAMEIRSVAMAPVLRDGALVATVFLNHRDPRAWTDADAALLQEVARRTWAAVERERAEAQRRDSETRLRIAQEAAGLGIFELDLATGTMVCDRRIHAMFGIPEGTSCSRDGLLSSVVAEDRPDVAAAFDRATARDSTPFAVECRIVPLGGTDPVWVAMSGQAVEAPRGWRRIIGSVRDVSARRRADDRLHALNTDLATRVARAVGDRNQLWALTDDLLITADFEGRIHEVSESWRSVLGYDPAALQGTGYAPLIHPDDMPMVAQQLAALSGGQRSLSYENRVRGADGAWRMIAWRVAHESGTGRLYGIGRDVTAERAQARALAEAEARLHESQKVETVGRLTGGVAHDFNNLLAAIVANLEMAQKRAADPAVQTLIAGAVSAAARGATLTKRLLAFARRQDLKAEQARPAALVDGIGELLLRALGPDIDLRLAVPEGLGAIHVDVNQLEMALLNLAVNARDAMPDGGSLTVAGRVEAVTAHPSLTPGPYVVLAVTDTGSGMDDETLRRAAEPFFTTKGVGKGTGLGLSTVHGLAAQSGGEMRLTSAPGQGTTVELWLPQVPEVAAAAAAPPPPPTPAAGRPLRILVVDDDVLVAMGTTAMVEDLGHEVVEVHSGAQALEALPGRGPFDLVISDHAMPGMSGTALAERLGPGVPVILATGYAEVPGGDAGLVRLNKPFGQAEVARAIAQALTRR